MMVDEKTPAGSADRESIDVGEELELRGWELKLGCTEGQVMAAVMAVGPLVIDVKRHLCKR